MRSQEENAVFRLNYPQFEDRDLLVPPQCFLSIGYELIQSEAHAPADPPHEFEIRDKGPAQHHRLFGVKLASPKHLDKQEGYSYGYQATQELQIVSECRHSRIPQL